MNFGKSLQRSKGILSDVIVIDFPELGQMSLRYTNTKILIVLSSFLLESSFFSSIISGIFN